jgi:hypothetical protein
MRLNYSALALVCALCVSKSFSQDQINVVTTAVPFLRISPDARSGGMGDMGVATSPDANSMFYNLAKTPFNKTNAGIALNYTPWLQSIGVSDVYLATVSGYYKLDEVSAISGSLRYFNLGSIQFTDFSGNNISTGKPTEISVGAGYSRKLSEKLGVGVALNYINSNLTRGYAGTSGVTYKAGTTVAGDLSAYYDNTTEEGKGVRVGLALTNLGGKIGYTNDATQKDYIPANISLGITNTSVLDEDIKLTYGIEFNKLLVPTPPLPSGSTNTSIDSAALANYRNKGVVDSWFSSFSDMKSVTAAVGGEFSYQDQFFLRAGYFYEDKTRGNRKFFTAGLGIKYEVFGLNFSYLVPSGSGVNQNPLSNTLRFSLLFDLDKAAAK